MQEVKAYTQGLCNCFSHVSHSTLNSMTDSGGRRTMEVYVSTLRRRHTHSLQNRPHLWPERLLIAPFRISLVILLAGGSKQPEPTCLQGADEQRKGSKRRRNPGRADDLRRQSRQRKLRVNVRINDESGQRFSVFWGKVLDSTVQVGCHYY